MTSLLSVSDADGDALTAYHFWDDNGAASSGHFVVGGVGQPSGVWAGNPIEVSAAQIGNAQFEAGAGTDKLWVRAYDGFEWSAWKSFDVMAPASAFGGNFELLA